MNNLERFVRRRWLRRQRTSAVEIGNILDVVNRDLELSKTSEFNLDWRYNIAYNAGLQLCKVVLRASGYKTGSGAPSHHVMISCLPDLMGPAQEQRSEYLDACRTTRNKVEYDLVGLVSETDVESLIAEVEDLKREVIHWLREEHPDLI